MEIFITSLQFIGSIIGLICVAAGATQLERIASQLEEISNKLDAQANAQEPAQDATRLLLEKLDATIGRTYATPSQPTTAPRRGRKSKV